METTVYGKRFATDSYIFLDIFLGDYCVYLILEIFLAKHALLKIVEYQLDISHF